MTTTKHGSDIGNNINNNDDDDDGGDEWDWDNVRKKYWTNLELWCRTNPTANIIRFNVYDYLVTKSKPEVRPMLTDGQGNGSKKKIWRMKEGWARIFLEWKLPMGSKAWERLVEEQREVLAKSDMYKIFNNGDSSSALTYKGDVLELMVYLCCALMPNNEKGTSWNSASPFVSNMVKKINKQMKEKIERFITKIIQKIIDEQEPVSGRQITLKEHPETSANAQAYDGNLIFKLNKTWQFKIV